MPGGMKVKLKLSKEQKALAEKIVQDRLKLISDNIESEMKNTAVPHLIDLVMKNYDKLGERMERLGPEDPTNPALWRDVFKAKLEKDALDTFFYDRNTGIIKVNLGEKTYLGYGDEPSHNDNSPMVWMVYYLEGLAGNWAWITKDIYEKAYPTSVWDSQWGRFKDAPGFMLSAGEFFARTKMTKHGPVNVPWRKVASWSEVKHPFSAFSPIDIFAEAMNEFDIRPFVEKALKAALAGKKL